MGRGKPPMALIASEKQRNLTFKKRKDGLFKKVHELTTLCGVKACAVIYGPNGSLKPETWPPQDGPDTVRQLFDVYKARKRDLGQVRSYGVADFFEERKKKAEDELHRLREKNRESKYPSWFKDLDSYSESELRQFGAVLKNKIDSAAWKIEQFKETEREFAELLSPSNNLFSDDHQQQQQQGLSYPLNHQDPMMTMKNNNYEIPPHHHQQQGLSYPVNHQDPMMMMVAMKNNNYEIPPPPHHQFSNIMMNNNEIPPHHHHQISYLNCGQQGGALVNGTAPQQLDIVPSNHQNQQGFVQMHHHQITSELEPQIPYMTQSMPPMNVSVPVLSPQAPYLQQNNLIMPTNVSVPVLPPQAPYLQRQISNDIELPAELASLGWDHLNHLLNQRVSTVPAESSDIDSVNGGLEDIVASMMRRR